MKPLFNIVAVRLPAEASIMTLAHAVVLSWHHGPEPAQRAVIHRWLADFGVASGFAFGLLVIYWLLVRVVEQRPAAEVNFQWTFVGLGMAMGFILFSTVYLVLGLLHVATWGGFLGFDALPSACAMALTTAVGEELLFRGVMLRTLEDAFGSTAALMLTAVLFGALHAGNPSATYLSTSAIALEAGVLLAAAYFWSRNLWLPIGLHLAWNLTEGGLFGAAVSGSAARGVVSVPLSATASVALTGGDFGPEASAVAVLVCLAAAGAFIVRAKVAGRWQPWRFRMVVA